MNSNEANTGTIEIGSLKISFPMASQPGIEPAIDLKKMPQIGDYWDGQGGVYVGFVRGPATSCGWHLILPVDPSACANDLTWGPYREDVLEACHPSDGLANTEALLSRGADYPAAAFAHGVSVDGHNDFYLPARRELALIEMNVHELIEKGWYWSSTQSSASIAWAQYFDDRYQSFAFKYDKGRSRAVRRVKI